ncbi:antitoxin [Brachybacterium nesterenkovii]|uniref:antitoxin n=1 Tax=Brachybacterium nesterenkovii TaxID=47847 RepID=UPI00321B86D2
MGFDDALNKAKDFAGQHEDQANQALDGAEQKATDLAPDQFDGAVGQGADQAREHLGLGADEQGQPGA